MKRFIHILLISGMLSATGILSVMGQNQSVVPEKDPQLTGPAVVSEQGGPERPSEAAFRAERFTEIKGIL